MSNANGPAPTVDQVKVMILFLGEIRGHTGPNAPPGFEVAVEARVGQKT